MERAFVIHENELVELISGYLKFIALENGGVDNWEWYSTSFCEFLDNNQVEDFEEIAKKELSKYDQLTD